MTEITATSPSTPHRSLIVMLFFIALVGFITMPSETYIGDPATSIEEAFQVVNEGHFWTPLERVRMMQGPENEGQYFAQNVKSKRYYSKYGVACTLIMLPPVLAFKAAAFLAPRFGGLPGDSWCFILNIYYLLFTLLMASLLWKVATRFTPNPWFASLYVVTAIYGTFLWNYTRAQSMELFQITLMIALFEACLRHRGNNKGVVQIWFLFTCLCLLKAFYVTLSPFLLLFLLKNTTQKGQIFLKHFLFPLTVMVAAMGAVFTWRFGAPWLTGYHQWQPESVSFSGSWKQGFVGFLLSPQKSAFLHFPLLIVSLFTVRSFYRKFSREALFVSGILTMTMLVIGKMPSWTGDCCFGPRYLIFILPLAALPALELLNQWRSRFLQISVVAGLLLVSMALQLEINRHPFFLYWHLTGSTAYLADQEIDDYYKNRPLPLIYKEASAGVLHGRHWLVLEKLNRLESKERANALRTQLQALLTKSNYYWFR